MQTAIIVRGRLTTPTTVELDEPIDEFAGPVQIILHRLDDPRAPTEEGEAESIFQFLRELPAGARSREDIDRELQRERDAWDGR